MMMEGYNYRLNRFGCVRKCPPNGPNLMVYHVLFPVNIEKLWGIQAFWRNQDLKLEISLNSWVFQKGFFQWHLAQISSDCSRQTTTCSASLTHHSGLWWEEMLGKNGIHIHNIILCRHVYIYIQKDKLYGEGHSLFGHS